MNATTRPTQNTPDLAENNIQPFSRLHLPQALVPLVRETRHFVSRKQERGLQPGVKEFILEWAKPVYRSGEIFLTVREKDLPSEVRHSVLAKRAKGWVLVLTHTGALVTAYWNKNAVSHLKRKPRQALKDSQWANRQIRRREIEAVELARKKRNRKHRLTAEVSALIPFNNFAA